MQSFKVPAFKILIVGESDWANFGARIARGINSLSGDATRKRARVFVQNAHPFGYAEDLVGDWSDPALRALLDQMQPGLDWIVALGNDDWFRDLLYQHKLHRLPRAVVHVGSAFRADPMTCTTRDTELDFRVRFLAPDLYGFAAHDPRAVPFVPPGEADLPASRPRSGVRPLVVSHVPSNPFVKGTRRIREVLQPRVDSGAIDLRIAHDVPFAAAAAARSEAHVYIDQITDAVDIGGFGAAAVEAMSQRLAVVGDIRHVRRHEASIGQFFPLPPILHTETDESLLGILDDLAAHPGALTAARNASATWARQWASPAAVGRYWLTALWARA